TFLYGLLSSGLLLFTAGCNEDWNTGGSGTGQLNIVLSLDTDSYSSRSRASEAPDRITVDDLAITLTPDDPKGSVRQWNSINDFSNSEKFAVGGYTLEAGYGDLATEGFQCPHYYGAARLNVRENDITNVTLDAKLANAMVTPTYTDAFTGYFTNYSLEFRTIKGNSIVYAANETRPVYVAPGSVQLIVNVVKPNGVAAAYQATSFVAEAQHHYHLTLDVNGGNVGSVGSITISFDDSVEQEDVTIDLSDDLTNIPAPTLITEGFDSGDMINLVAGTAPDDPLQVTLSARGGLASVMLETSSTSLKEQGWPEKIDLLAVPVAVQTTMTSLGFLEIGLWHNPDKMAVVDLTNVLSNIKYINGFDNKSSFTLTVTDKLSQTAAEPVVLTVDLDKLQLDIAESAPVLYYSPTATVGIDYNGADVDNRVALQYLNRFGTWVDLTTESIEAASRALNRYTVTVSGLPDDDVYGEAAVTLRALAKNKAGATILTSNELPITRTPVPSIKVEPGDVFTSRAAASLRYGAHALSDYISRARVELSTDGGKTFEPYTYSVDGNDIKFDGLTPATDYVARVTVDDLPSRLSSFTTEAEKSLDEYNGNMEGWYNENAPHSQTTGFGADAIRWYAKAQGDDDFWATRNALTTSTSSGPTPNYVSYSGTRSAAGRTGLAAEISTMGYGEGSTYTGSGGNCKHKAAGMLFIGSHSAANETTETIEYGRPWTSRPSSFSFAYKYAPYNNESFRAYIVVENRDNGVVELGRGEFVSGEAKTGFVDQTVDIEYTVTDMKATHLYIVFVSSTLEAIDAPAVKNVNGSKGMFQGYTDARRIGSVLTVDDIKLNY
ncbi:MAG: DUF4493 domain-containing protein, partial [Muribaculaceae bacterium]|nr:DUF4493 domain-containing protein [Muribaculaceae bacterium]